MQKNSSKIKLQSWSLLSQFSLSVVGVHDFPSASFSVPSRTLVMCVSLKEHATFGCGLFLHNLLIPILQVLTLKDFWPYQNVSAGGFQATTRTCSLPSNGFVLYPFKSGHPPPPPTQGSSCLVSFKPVEQDLIQPKSKGKLVLLFFKFNYFWLLGLHCCMHFSLVSGSGGYSLVVMCRLLFAVASLVTEHRLLEPSGFNNRSSQAVEHRLISCGPQA